jgi:XkdW protein
MTARLAEAIRYLYPDASLIVDVVIEDDGGGPRIAAWRLPGDPPTDQQVADALAAIDAQPPPRRMVAKSLIISRLIEAGKIEAARAALEANASAYARWWAPDKPAIYADDPEAIALLQSIGADPAAILAPES